MKRRREHSQRHNSAISSPIAPPATIPETPRWFRRGLALIGLICLIRGIVILATGWQSNPFAKATLEDANVYWTWAEEIAGGRWIGETPFLSAPLYPYLLGLIRAFGGGLPVVYGFQLILYVATVLLIGCIAKRRFGPRAGIAGAILFALLTDPMFFVGRVLNCVLQVFLVCALWRQLLATQDRPSLRSWAVTGLLAGLNCLANPPMLLLVFLLGPWAYFQGPRRPQGAIHVILAVIIALAVISPAAIHNHFATHGEFIPLTAESGLTFYHGNHPGADGTYSPVPGMSIHRRLQHADAERLYEKAIGRPGNWNEVSRFFRQKGTEFLASDLSAAATLLARKFYWFLTSRNYGDIYLPTLEIDAGFGVWMRTAPLSLPWLIPPALVALIALLRKPNRYAPEIMLLALPVLTVLMFLYNPRYRLPAGPVIAVLAGWAFCQAWSWRTHIRWSVGVSISVVFAAALTAANIATGFDAPALYQVLFENTAGLACTQAGKPDQAVEWFHKALATNPAFTTARSNLIRSLDYFGRTDEALFERRRAVEAGPGDASLRNDLGIVLADKGLVDEALGHFREAVRLEPGSAEYQNSLGNALLAKGLVDEALGHYQAALRADPKLAATHVNIGMLYANTNRPDEALAHFDEAIRLNPGSSGAYYQKGRVLLKRGQTGEGLAAMRRAQALMPDNVSIASSLAWLLATTPEPFRDPAGAVALAQRANLQAQGHDANILDTFAAALAAAGRFEEAARSAQDALNLAVQQNQQVLIPGIRERLELYRTGRAYTGQLTPEAPRR